MSNKYVIPAHTEIQIYGYTEPGSDISVLRKSLSYSADTYSILLTKKNIDALLYAAKIVPSADKATGTEKYFTDEFILKANSGLR